MGLMLKIQRDGVLRDEWYGVYTEGGKRKVVNLNVPIRGTPPASFSLRDQGDEPFEASRQEAQKELDRYAAEASHKGRSEHLTERLIESKTGRALQYVPIADLAARWRKMGRKVRAGEGHLNNCDAHFERFVAFMQARHPKAQYLYEVTPEDAAAFVDLTRPQFAPSTAQYGIRLLSKSMSRFLPVGAVNPFAEFVGGRSNVAATVIHRKPFTQDELHALFSAARQDPFMYPLIVTAACTGMRRGDVCALRWSDVDLPAGMLTVRTSKTGKRAEIPIFGSLREVLAGIKPPHGEYVFPAAAKMLRQSPRSLSWRFKCLVAASMDAGVILDHPRVEPATVEAEGVAAIMAKVPEGGRRERILDAFRRYCAGASVRSIEKDTGSARATVSADLNLVQSLIGQPFLPSRSGDSVTAAVARVTRVRREGGHQKSASIRDWHALRTTYVTLALSAGVPVELVRRVTGHATVDIVLENYFRPDREQFKSALNLALPVVLTGGSHAQSPTPAEELRLLADKVAAGTASAGDRKRLRVVATMV